MKTEVMTSANDSKEEGRYIKISQGNKNDSCVSYNIHILHANAYVISPGQKFNQPCKGSAFSLKDGNPNSDDEDEDIERYFLQNKSKKVPKSNESSAILKTATINELRQPSQKESQLSQAGTSRASDLDNRSQKTLSCGQDLTTLVVREIPKDITPDDLRTRYPEILNIKIPRQAGRLGNNKYCAFLEFENQKKANEHFKLLQRKKLKGHTIVVYKKTKVADVTVTTKNRSKTELIISGYPIGTMVYQIAYLFPKSISVHADCKIRATFVSFNNEEDACDGLAKNLRIGGKKLRMKFAMKKAHPKKK